MAIPIPVQRYKYRFYFYERTNPNIKYLDETHAVNVYDGTDAGMTGRIYFDGGSGFPLNTYMTPYYLNNTSILPQGESLNFKITCGTTVVLDVPVRVSGTDIFIGGGTNHEGDRFAFSAIKASDGTTRAMQMGRINDLFWYTENLKDGAIIDGEPEESGFPYGDGGESDTGDSGTGEMTDTSVDIAIDNISPLFLGQLFRVYKLSVTQLSELSNFLTSAEFIDNIRKLFSDPMDYIVSLSAMPTNVFTGVSSPLKIGNVTSNINGVLISNFIADIDCGSIEIPKYFGTFMDYSPYTSITLMLNGIGSIPLNVDAFMGQSVHVKYRVDVLTGQCVVFVSNDRGLISTHTGNISYHIPLRSKDYSEFFSGVLGVVGNTAMGNYGGAVSGLMQTAHGIYKPNIVQGGALSGNTSVMSNKKPYLIIERPSISLPSNYRSVIGWNSQVYKKLSDIHGLTVVKEMHLDNVTATAEEKEELYRLLKSGVVLP